VTAGAVALGLPAPEFALPDWRGRPFALAELRGSRHGVLVFNRGFT